MLGRELCLPVCKRENHGGKRAMLPMYLGTMVGRELCLPVYPGYVQGGTMVAILPRVHSPGIHPWVHLSVSSSGAAHRPASVPVTGLPR